MHTYDTLRVTIFSSLLRPEGSLRNGTFYYQKVIWEEWFTLFKIPSTKWFIKKKNQIMLHLLFKSKFLTMTSKPFRIWISPPSFLIYFCSWTILSLTPSQWRPLCLHSAFNRSSLFLALKLQPVVPSACSTSALPTDPSQDTSSPPEDLSSEKPSLVISFI